MKFFRTLSFVVIFSSLYLVCFEQTNKSSPIICSNSIPSNQPLWVMVLKSKSYIVDNIGIKNINANSIEDVKVLKDAQATSLYGYRAQNGVVLITIKVGEARKELRRFKPYLSEI